MPESLLPRRPIKRGRLDLTKMTVTFGVGDDAEIEYACGPLAQDVLNYLTLRGLKSMLLSTRRPHRAYEQMLAGKLPRPVRSTPRRHSKWREAVAFTLAYTRVRMTLPANARKAVIEQRVADELPEMMEWAAALDKNVIRTLSRRADVQEHYRRLWGDKDGQTDLLALAGMEPPIELPHRTDAHEPAAA